MYDLQFDRTLLSLCNTYSILHYIEVLNCTRDTNAMLLYVLVYCAWKHHHSSGNKHRCPRNLCNGKDQHQVEQAPSGLFSTEEDRTAPEDLQDHL